MVVVVKDITCLIAYLQSLLHESIVTLRTIGAVTIEMAMDIIYHVPFCIVNRLSYIPVDGVDALTDICFRMLINNRAVDGINSQRISITYCLPCFTATSYQ